MPLPQIEITSTPEEVENPDPLAVALRSIKFKEPDIEHQSNVNLAVIDQAIILALWYIFYNLVDTV